MNLLNYYFIYGNTQLGLILATISLLAVYLLSQFWEDIKSNLFD